MTKPTKREKKIKAWAVMFAGKKSICLAENSDFVAISDWNKQACLKLSESLSKHLENYTEVVPVTITINQPK